MAETTAVAKKDLSSALMETLESKGAAIPKELVKERFVSNAVTVLNDHRDYASYGTGQIITCCVKAAVMGLDFLNKEAYLVPYKGTLTFMPSYTGLKKVAKTYSIRPILDINGYVVREGDELTTEVTDDNAKFSFKQIPFNTKPIIGAFSYVKFKDGGCMIDIMNIDELRAARNQSASSNSPAWKNFESEMYRKISLKRICKHIEIDFASPEMRKLWDADAAINTDEKVKVDNSAFDDDDVIDVEAK